MSNTTPAIAAPSPARTVPDALSQLLDSLAPEGLAVDRQPTGYTASIFYGLEGAEGKWSDRVFAGTASEAIAKALRLHGRVGVAPSTSVAPVPIAPPPY